MKRRVLVVAAAVAALAIGLAWFIWPRHDNGPLLRLKIVRRAVEQGQPVAFFTVEGGDQRRTRIGRIERVAGDRVEPFDPRGRPGQKFWAPSSAVPMWDLTNPNIARAQFGVVAPVNATVWKLRVRVLM